MGLKQMKRIPKGHVTGSAVAGGTLCLDKAINLD